VGQTGLTRLLLLLCGTVVFADAAAERTFRIVTTFLPGYCFAANVAGDLAVVENLLPGAVSLHDYQLTPGDLGKLTSADLIIVNGLGMETFLEKVIQNSPGTKGKIVAMSTGLERQLLQDETHQQPKERNPHPPLDPHIWLDPVIAAHCVTNIAAVLQRLDVRNAEGYAKNATVYVRQLHTLDEHVAVMLAPVKEAPFITYHNAFRYFVRRYGLNVAGVVERVPEIAPSAGEMRELYETIRQKNVRALFTEPGGRPRLAQQIARDTGIKLGELDPLETGKLQRDSYEKGLRRNAAALVKALSK
jgi:zinc transport system substrate-binding protein